MNTLLISAAASALLAGTAGAQAPRVQTAGEALAQDAGEYARQNRVSLEEAMRRLRAQEESVAATDAIRNVYANRLAGVSIEHSPDYRIVVLLTGSAPVPDREIVAGETKVPVVFRTDARATGEQIVSAMMHHREAIRAALPNASGMGLDPRTGELVLMVKRVDANRFAPGELDSAMEALVGVPVRIRVLDAPDANLSVEGGARLEGVDPANGKRYACTTGFVVANGARNGIVTAAHCPDVVTYHDRQGSKSSLGFAGQWGWRYQDVQVHVTPDAARPLFFADSAKTLVRTVTGARPRTSTRAGDFVCRRGETTGYSCAQVELVDYAPPGELCGGPCDPVWVTVPGPSCKGGDSGAPIFLGTVAFGIVKGGNYSPSGTCNFYYYMSTDYLPAGWGLLRG
ncbi:MAG TPA: hypothetical protein VF582_00650 [Allosphingosinicella sp.]